jgi:hypothetical protein
MPMKRVGCAACSAAVVFLILGGTGCGQGAKQGDEHAAATPYVDTSGAETLARTFVEISGTFDYRDQESQYQRLLPLLADEVPFQENSTAVSTRRIETTRVIATRKSAVSDDDAIITVTAHHFRSYLPYASSEVVEERLLEQVDCRLVMQQGRWLVSRCKTLSEEPLLEGNSTPGAPTPSGEPAATSWDYDEGTGEIIKGLVMKHIERSSRIQGVQVGGNVRYTDSSGTDWISFTVFPIPPASTDPAFGVIRGSAGGGWELAYLGTGSVGDALPQDVREGLGIAW